MNLAAYLGALEKMSTVRWTGAVTQLIGLLIESEGPAAAMGDFCENEKGPSWNGVFAVP